MVLVVTPYYKDIVFHYRLLAHKMFYNNLIDRSGGIYENAGKTV